MGCKCFFESIQSGEARAPGGLDCKCVTAENRPACIQMFHVSPARSL